MRDHGGLFMMPGSIAQWEDWKTYFGEQYVTEGGPISPDELLAVQSRALVDRRLAFNNLCKFTCHGCAGNRVCTFAYDSYNTDGDCLMEK